MRRLLKPHVILIAFILFVASIPLQLQATSRPEFCVSCHEMRPMVATFEKSTHAAVGCMGCHTDPGYLNYVRDKIHAAFNDVYHHFAGFETPIHTRVPNYRCLSCHPTIATRNVFQQLDAAHSTHLARGITCTTCHLKVGHQTFTMASAGNIGERVVSRFEQTHRKTTLETCFAAGCHDNKVARTACVTCHVDQQRVKPKSHRPGFMAVHGDLARKDARDCFTCHKAIQTPVIMTAASGSSQAAFQQLLGSQFCQNCHMQQNPHPEGFERMHGPEAKAADATCATCHTDRKAFCDSCHKTPMPHPAGFEHRHGQPAGANCQYCHQRRECDSCHRTLRPASHSPQFIKQHGAASRASGADCQFCHQKRDCEGCHHATRPATHTADFRVKHGDMAKAGTQNCMLCHRKTTCDTCHQLPMPHPSKYQASHTVDATRRESACANCHKKSYCLQCHESDEIHLPNVRRPEESLGSKPLAQGTGGARERDLMSHLDERQSEPVDHECPAMAGRAQEFAQLRAFLQGLAARTP